MYEVELEFYSLCLDNIICQLYDFKYINSFLEFCKIKLRVLFIEGDNKIKQFIVF